MLGSLTSAPMLRVFCQRSLISGSSLLASLSWIMVGLSRSSYLLCAARILLGCGNAFLMAVVPSYISSVAPSSCRGFLCSCYSLAIGLGLIFAVTVGDEVGWTTLSYLSSTFTFVLFASTPILPRSSDLTTTPPGLSSAGDDTPYGTSPTTERPIPLFAFLASMFMFSGICPLSTYPQDLFADQETIAAADLVIYSMVCQVVGGLVGAVAIERMGRKPVLQTGAWITLLSNVLLSLYFSTVSETNRCPATAGSVLCWTPVIATCAFFFGFGGGIGNLFFVLLGEVRLALHVEDVSLKGKSSIF